eukprot:CAMPEP_0115041050 /NCGR_PEP_ID=MMETSP0216-20121206/45274_1 /TAXON_ID=223996 /ORGANISM="Protocruzia adherens, Strain Boccale" /LENGTH=280 /DNA_ID=CAMNT_0002422569 /DNA_START=151 /DNA_END=994 /DNA_ORIENTATION=-
MEPHDHPFSTDSHNIDTMRQLYLSLGSKKRVLELLDQVEKQLRTATVEMECRENNKLIKLPIPRPHNVKSLKSLASNFFGNSAGLCAFAKSSNTFRMFVADEEEISGDANRFFFQEVDDDGIYDTWIHLAKRAEPLSPINDHFIKARLDPERAMTVIGRLAARSLGLLLYDLWVGRFIGRNGGRGEGRGIYLPKAEVYMREETEEQGDEDDGSQHVVIGRDILDGLKIRINESQSELEFYGDDKEFLTYFNNNDWESASVLSFGNRSTLLLKKASFDELS